MLRSTISIVVILLPVAMLTLRQFSAARRVNVSIGNIVIAVEGTILEVGSVIVKIEVHLWDLGLGHPFGYPRCSQGRRHGAEHSCGVGLFGHHHLSAALAPTEEHREVVGPSASERRVRICRADSSVLRAKATVVARSLSCRITLNEDVSCCV